jgi:enoyl-CoA hydratase
VATRLRRDSLRSASPKDIAVLILESEDGLPRIERQVLAEIASQIEEGNATRAFSGFVITGTEQAFAVGADISEIARLTPSEAHDFSREGQRVMRLVVSRSCRPLLWMRWLDPLRLCMDTNYGTSS